jgi:polyhydroxyalkanoate synthase subunit PhaC
MFRHTLPGQPALAGKGFSIQQEAGIDMAQTAAAPRPLTVAAGKRDASGPGNSVSVDRQSEGLARPARAAKPTPAESGSSGYLDADHHLHAALASMTFGISPISLLEAWQDWMLHLAASPGKQQEIRAKAFENLVRFLDFVARCTLQEKSGEPCISPLPQDRRFAHPGWMEFPFNQLHQSFLLAQQWWHNATVGIPGVTPQHERMVEFFSRQFLDVFSPSNFAISNPEVVTKTIKDGGVNFVRGMEHMLDDAQRQFLGRPPFGTEAFRPGTNVAVTPGKVIFRNALMELIQYIPATDKVRPEPILIVPAWIMKYYILDLSPENSLIRFLVNQGYTVFCISWVNPGNEHRNVSLDDYRKLGFMAALDAVSGITGAMSIHGVGYCLGGTLLSIAAAAMARDGDSRLASLSLFATQLDFSEPGELGLFINDSQVSFLEDIMWKEGVLDQRRMAGAFQMLRSQDLVWSRMIREYLMGERAPTSDLMAWNADTTRMPFVMQSQYLRRLFLGNDLAQGRFEVEGGAVHVEDITVPVFALGTVADHVAPWRSVFKVTRMFESDVTFVLTSGGHNAGVISEPGNKRRSFQALDLKHGSAHPNPDSWSAEAGKVSGSWWPVWTDWLKERSGPKTALRPAESRSYPPLCAAPGTYVHQR